MESVVAGFEVEKIEFTCFPWEVLVLGKGDVWQGRGGEKRQEEEKAEVVPCTAHPGNDPKIIF